MQGNSRNTLGRSLRNNEFLYNPIFLLSHWSDRETTPLLENLHRRELWSRTNL